MESENHTRTFEKYVGTDTTDSDVARIQDRIDRMGLVSNSTGKTTITSTNDGVINIDFSSSDAFEAKCNGIVDMARNLLDMYRKTEQREVDEEALSSGPSKIDSRFVGGSEISVDDIKRVRGHE